MAGARVLARTALLGPAFVAAVAYVDPGNVATNLTGGASYGYLLVWVVVASSAMAALVQYLSAKLGVVTGRSLPELLGERLPTVARLPFWLQAELVAIATDLAEVVGGAIALGLLFHLPLLVGGVITAAVSIVLLAVRDQHGQHTFERVVTGLLLVIACGFVAGLFVEPPSVGGIAGGLVPGFAGSGSVLIAAGMLGATVMPHVVYLHSALARDRHGDVPPAERAGVLSTTRLDIGIAMALAGLVNVSMLLLAASALHGGADTTTITGAYAEIARNLGKVIAVLFAVGLLASGFASTSVGCYAGAVVMQGLLRKRVPLLLRRVVTALPALGVLAMGVDPTRALVVSQVVLSLGIPFALVPLVAYTSRRSVAGDHANARATTVVAAVVATAIVALNVALLVITFSS
ncbi:MAG: Nramp family divalent metal transporter [Streptosporangiales bacterium]|nr:Nramp family divalent metal transporter [Streptosporangiales bacterium]MBO0892531.1 Nramp family divalent metal transporter [Acidothermales bacterium]